MFAVVAFYRFFALEDPSALVAELRENFVDSGLLGTTLVAPEGINGTIAGDGDSIESFLSFLTKRTGLDRNEVKFSHSVTQPFRRLKFKQKKEIITFRNTPVDPSRGGQYVAPSDWNALLSDPEVLLLDTRNTYETEIGTFAGAVTPSLENFSAFANWVRDNLNPAQHRKVAMFCTGGIRCEKASAFMLQEGFAEVFHLKGGILKYLEEIDADESRWEGQCYIFDERVSVTRQSFRAQPQNQPK